MTEVRRHAAGTAHYEGNHEDIVGRAFGPLTYGGHVVAVAAVYNAADDMTTVEFAHSVVGDPLPEPVAPVLPARIVRQAWQQIRERVLAVTWLSIR